jgi:hypothetical protein
MGTIPKLPIPCDINKELVSLNNYGRRTTTAITNGSSSYFGVILM